MTFPFALLKNAPLSKGSPTGRISSAMLATLLSTLTVFILGTANEASACPKVRRLVDFNCDQQLKIVAAGDSIVFGRGDLDNRNRGGWVKRLGPLLKVPAVQNLGVPGITTEQLFSRLKKAFRNPNSSLRARAIDADIFIIGAGANDFYDHGDPSLTARNLKRIVAMVRQELGRGGRTAPHVLLAKLTPTTRGFQRSFTVNVNILLARYRSEALPSYLRFDLMDELEVSYDGLHPRATGYEQLATLAADYIRGDGTTDMTALRPDKDRDGIYDKFETSSFGTDPRVKDTDTDGLSDGAEQFTHSTDPLIADTDADGTSDGDEVALGRNPLAAD